MASTDQARTERPIRYRCTGCGNLTRFDVTTSRRARAFHHFTVGGELEIEDVEVLSEVVEDVRCRWCGTGSSVVELATDGAGASGRDDVPAGTGRSDAAG